MGRSNMEYVLAPIPAYALLVRAAYRYAPFLHARDSIVNVLRQVHNAHLALFSVAIATDISTRWYAESRLPSACATPPVAWNGLVNAWYASKFWEWADTVILVARRKPVSTLHYWHHMLTPCLVALQTLHRTTHTPLFEVGTFLNALVHAWMYLYYLAPHTMRRTRRALTTCQLLQHVVMLSLIVYSTTRSECDRDASGNLAGLALYLFFTVQFYFLL